MTHIRQATVKDLVRVAEIEIFNYRLNFYPIFQNDAYYFDELRVDTRAAQLENVVNSIWVYDDGVVKGFIQIDRQTVKKLFVEPVLHGNSIGGELLRYAINEFEVNSLWALEKNIRAIAFYERHGFRVTGDRMPEDDTTEYLVRLER